MLSTYLTVLLAVLAGTAVACVLGLLPGLHIYNVMGVLVLGVLGLAKAGIDAPRSCSARRTSPRSSRSSRARST